MDVADWLRALGLDQYEAAFRANDVDAELLPSSLSELSCQPEGLAVRNQRA